MPLAVGSASLTGRAWLDDVLRAALIAVVGIGLWLVAPEVSVSWGTPVAETPLSTVVLMTALAAVGIALRSLNAQAGLAVSSAVVLAAVLGGGLSPLGVLFCFGDTLYSAVLRGSRRASWTVAALAAAVAAAVALTNLISDGGRAALMSLLNLGLLLAVPVFWALEVRHQVEKTDAERARAEQADRLAALDRDAAVTAERARMARDLHDVIAGQLSAIAIQSEAVLSIPDPDPALLRRVLTSVRRDSVSSLAEMRTMIGLLRADGSADGDPRTAPAGLDRLDDLVRTARATGLDVRVEDRREAAAPFAAATDLAAFRIVQESLTNAAKHAPGTAVTVVLRHDPAGLVVEVANPLVDAPSRTGGTGTGLLGLAERAAAVGGSVTSGAQDGRWRLRAVLPLGVPTGSRS